MTTLLPIRRSTIDRAGICTSVLETGSGRAAIFVHGTSSSAEMGWGTLLPQLSVNKRCLAPDLIGSGETRDDGRALTLEILIAQIRAVAEKIGEEAIDLIGYSLGGVVAAAAAAEMPERIRRLAIIGGWAKSDQRMRLLFASWQALARSDRRQLAHFILLNGLSDHFFETCDLHMIDIMLERYTENLAPGSDRQAALDATIDISKHLAKIRADTLVIGMAHDRMVPPAHCRTLANAIDGAHYKDIDSGHLVMLERPQQLLQLLEEHLR